MGQEKEGREMPKENIVYVTVSGFSGSGKSAVCGEIEIALKATGVDVKWTNGDSEKNMTHADWQTWLETYKPCVLIEERNISRPNQ